MKQPGKAKAKAKRGSSERAQGKPPGQTGINAKIPAGRDMRKSAPTGNARKKTDQTKTLA